MAVQHDATVSAQGGDVSSLSVSLTIASNSNRYIIAHAYAGNDPGPGAFSSLTWNTSENLANLWSNSFSSFARIEAWGLKNPTATTANATVSYGALRQQVAIIAGSYYGVDQTTPVGTARTATGTTTTMGWIGIDDAQSNGLVVGASAQDLGASPGTPTQALSNGIADYRAAGTSSQSAGATSLAPALPASTQRGDLVFATCMSANNETHSSSTTGWTKLGQTNSGTGFTVSHWWAIQDGALSAPTITWTSSVACGAKCFTYIDADPVTPIAYLGTVGTGTTSTHTSTGGNTTENNVLAVYVDHCLANTALGTPAGWAENSDAGSATGPNRYTVGSKDVVTSGTGSGNISVTGGAAAWVQQQCEVYEGPTATHRDEEENINADGFGSFGVADETGAAYNTLLWHFSGGTATWGTGAVALHPVTTVNNSVTLSPASYALTGTGLAAVTKRNVTLSAASYALTGSGLAAQTKRNVALSAAAYTITASTLSVSAGRNVTLSAGSYALTGASLAAQTKRNAVLSAASFVFTGSGLETLVTRNVALTRATFAFTGASLDVQAGIQVDYAVTLSPATFTLTGASLEATYTAGAAPAPVAASTGTTGGGPAASFYRGKYRHDIRKAIRRALHDLSGVRTSRSRKRRVRRIAREFAEQFTFEVPAIVFARMPDAANLEPIRLQLVQLGQALREQELQAGEARAKQEELARLFQAYEAEAARLDQQEEEEAIAMIIALAA